MSSNQRLNSNNQIQSSSQLCGRTRFRLPIRERKRHTIHPYLQRYVPISPTPITYKCDVCDSEYPKQERCGTPCKCGEYSRHSLMHYSCRLKYIINTLDQPCKRCNQLFEDPRINRKIEFDEEGIPTGHVIIILKNASNTRVMNVFRKEQMNRFSPHTHLGKTYSPIHQYQVQRPDESISEQITSDNTLEKHVSHLDTVRNHLSKEEINTNDLYDLNKVGNISCLEKLIGSGTYCRVYSGFLKGNDSNKVAVKIFKPDSESHMIALQNEVKIVDILMKKPQINIIQYLNHFYSTDPNSSTHFFISELADSDLFKFVSLPYSQGKFHVFQHEYCRNLIYGIAQGLSHLNSLGVAHGDIKLENILICEKPSNKKYSIEQRLKSLVPKFTDFNNSCIGKPGNPIMIEYPCCTLYSAAPETWFSDEPYDIIKADIYSIGIVFLCLINGEFPFIPSIDNISEEKSDWLSIIYKKDRNIVKAFVKTTDEILRELLIKTLDPNPNERITVQEFIDHQYFRKSSLWSRFTKNFSNRINSLIINR